MRVRVILRTFKPEANLDYHEADQTSIIITLQIVIASNCIINYQTLC